MLAPLKAVDAPYGGRRLSCIHDPRVVRAILFSATQKQETGRKDTAAWPHHRMTGTRSPCTFQSNWFSGTDTRKANGLRARRRKWVRDDARAEWKRLKRNKGRIQGGTVRRPDRRRRARGEPALAFPSRAFEAVKPIVDAGTDAGLWPDDDSTHHCSTTTSPHPTHSPRATMRSPPTSCWCGVPHPLSGGRRAQHSSDAQWRKKAATPGRIRGWVANFTSAPHVACPATIRTATSKRGQTDKEEATPGGAATAFG